MQIITTTGVFPLPHPTGCEKSHTVAIIYPNRWFNREERKSIDRLRFGYLIIEADPFDESRPGTVPGDFNLATLTWAMRTATLVVLWGGQIPFTPERLTETLKAHVRPGGRIVIALIRDAHHNEWVRFAYEQSQGRAELFGIKGIPGVLAGAKRQTCQSSGAVH